jgi:hypothetical protein
MYLNGGFIKSFSDILGLSKRELYISAVGYQKSDISNLN